MKITPCSTNFKGLKSLSQEVQREDNRTIFYVNQRVYHPFQKEPQERIERIIEAGDIPHRTYYPSETGDGYYWIFKDELVKGEPLDITYKQYKKYKAIRAKGNTTNTIIAKVEHALKKVGLEHLIIK